MAIVFLWSPEWAVETLGPVVERGEVVNKKWISGLNLSYNTASSFNKSIPLI